MLPSLSSACKHSLSRIFAANYLLPRSDKTRYVSYCLVRLVLRIKDFNCFLLRYPVNFNCFLSHFNWVNTQIRSLIRVLDRVQTFIGYHVRSKTQVVYTTKQVDMAENNRKNSIWVRNAKNDFLIKFRFIESSEYTETH